MAMYLPGSNFQADVTQTLYLMNPGYSSTSNSGNMVLLSPSSTADVGQHNTLPNTDQQHQFNSFFLSPGLPHASMSHQSSLASTSINGNQLPSPSLFMVEVNNQAYNNPNGTRNELPFLSSSGDVSQTTQPLVASLSLVNGGQPSTSDMAQYSLRQQSLSAIQEHQSPSLSNGASLGWNMESSQGSNGPPGQGLSLSLSHQQNSLMQLRSFQMQPSESSMTNCVGMCELNGKDDSMRGERLPNRWTGSLSSFRASLRDGAIGNGLQNSLNGVGSGSQVHVEPSSSSAVGAPGSLIPCSKYLSAAQQLLDELLNVGRGLKISSNKHTRMQSLTATGFMGDAPFSSDKGLAETRNIDGVVSPTGIATATAISTATAILNTSVPDTSCENVPELTMPERQELQMKKAKLMAMLDEVVRRYRQYYNHIKVIVTSFESAAGVGTAKMYTALALQTISRNFCCLRDAISSQVQVASKALGENSSGQRVDNGGSRLQFADQRSQQQQRALQQLGMMQQHSWRPQRGLPERSVSVLRAWLFEHFLHPYPKDADKLMLARQTGLTRSQVSNWFINARVRLWKPMVEEMYLKESRGTGAGTETEAMASQLRNASNAGEEEEEEEEGEEGEEEGTGKGIVKQLESHVGVSEEKDESSRASNTMMMMMMNRRNQSRSLTPSGRHAFYDKEYKEALMKKSRDGGGIMTAAYDDNRSNLGMDIDQKAEEKGKLSNEMRDEGRQSFAIPCEDGMLTQGGDGLGGEGSFNIHLGSMGRYPQEAFRYAGNRGVSLTLGLQNCDNNAPALPILSHQQHYVTNGQALPTQRRHGLGSETEYYYTMHNETGGASSVGHSNEAIGFQNQERFAIQLLNDFVS